MVLRSKTPLELLVREVGLGAEEAVREIRRETRRRPSAEEKIGIAIEELRGEGSIASLCRREGLAANCGLVAQGQHHRTLLGVTSRNHLSALAHDRPPPPSEALSAN